MNPYNPSLDDGRVTFDPKPDALPAETMAKDLVCGMLVDPRQALLTEHHGHSYYFCSERCRSAFSADPTRFGG